MRLDKHLSKLPRLALAASLLAVLVFALAVFLTACTVSPSSEAAYPETEDDITDITETVLTLPAVRIATTQADDLLPLQMALEQNMLADRGVDLEIAEYASVEEKIQAVITGQADALTTDFATVVQLNTDGSTPVLVVTVVGDDPEAVLVFSERFLLGDPASGETTTLEASVEAVFGVMNSWDQAVALIDSDAANSPTFPKADLPDRRLWEPLLAQMYDDGELD